MFRSSALSIQFTPLVPIHPSTGRGDDDDTTTTRSSLPQCNLLKLESLTVLCECGGTPTFENDEILKAIAPYADEIDAILISSSELSCCGSLPQVLPLLRPQVKVLSTMATARLGILGVTAQFLSVFGNADALMSRVANLPTRPAPPSNLSIKSINSAFRSIKEVHFDQLTTILSIEHARLQKEQQEKSAAAAAAAALSSRRRGGRKASGASKRHTTLNSEADAALLSASNEIQHATIRAVSAGRVIGGSGFRIKYRDDDICYLGRFSTRDSFVVPGLNASSALNGANILICDGSAARIRGDDASGNPLVAVENVLKIIRETLRKGGTALLPTNAFGIGIDLMQKIESYFKDELGSYQLYFVSPKAKEHVDRLRLLSEYASNNSGWASENGPFSSFKLISSPADLQSMERAKCVICHTIDMKDSLTCALIQDCVKDSRNTILFTDTTSCTAQTAFGGNSFLANNNISARTVRDDILALRNADYKTSELRIKCRIRTILEGEDLESFREEDKARRDEEEKQAKLELERQRRVEAATEINMLKDVSSLANDDDDDDVVDAGKKMSSGDNKEKKASTKKQEPQLQHPKLVISKCFEIKKRVKQDILNFPGELCVSSSRVLQDFTGTSGGGVDDNNKDDDNNGGKDGDDYSRADARVWGIPLSESDLRRFRRFEAEANYNAIKNNQNDENNNSKRTSESQDEAPAYVREQELVMRKILCKVEFVDVSKWLDGTSLRVMLRTNCKSVKKLAFLNTTEEDAKALVHFCTSEDVVRVIDHQKVLKKKKKNKNTNRSVGDQAEEQEEQVDQFQQNIFCPQLNETIEMATAVFSCEIKLHPELLAEIASAQRSVETQSGSWQVAWAAGRLKRSENSDENNQQNNNNNASSSSKIPSRQTGAVRRQRDEEGDEENKAKKSSSTNNGLPILCPLDDDEDDNENAAIINNDNQNQNQQETHHDVGSIFVGELKLPLIERELKRKNQIRNITIELDDEAPLLVADSAVAIRGVNYKNSNSKKKNEKQQENENDDDSDDDNQQEGPTSSLAMEAVPCAAWFAARKAFRGSFSHIL